MTQIVFTALVFSRELDEAALLGMRVAFAFERIACGEQVHPVVHGTGELGGHCYQAGAYAKVGGFRWALSCFGESMAYVLSVELSLVVAEGSHGFQRALMPSLL